MAGIPVNVQKAAEEAEKFVTKGDAPIEPAPATTEQAPAPAPAPEQAAPSSELNTPPRAQPAAEPQPAPTATETLTAENARLSQSLSVLRGKFEAEVPRFAEDNRHLRDENRQLREESQKLKDAPPPPKVEPQDLSKVNLEEIFSEETLESYDEDMLREILAATQKHGVTPQLQAQQEELKQIRAEITQGSEQAFTRQVYSQIPEMTTLNTDEGFNDWLDGRINDLEPRTRRLAFTEAWSEQNIDGMATIVRQYGPTPATTLASNQTLPVTPDVASQVVPIAEGTMVPPTPAEGKSYSPQEFAKLSTSLTTGTMDDPSRARLKQELDEAIINSLVR